MPSRLTLMLTLPLVLVARLGAQRIDPCGPDASTVPMLLTAVTPTDLRATAHANARIVQQLRLHTQLFVEVAGVANGFVAIRYSETRPDSVRRCGFVELSTVRLEPLTAERAGEVRPPRADTVTVYKTDTLRLAGRVDTVTITNTVTYHDTVTYLPRKPEPPIRIRPEEVLPDPIAPPDMLAFAVGPFNVILREDTPYRVGSSADTIRVPKGFVTDFASIPRVLWSVLSPTGEFRLPAVIHDYLYWFQPCTREESDNLLLIAMKEEGVPERQRVAVYTGIRIAGQVAWDADSTARTSGELKVLPDSVGRPSPKDTWDTMRTRLMERGVRGDARRMRRQHYCQYGDRQDVPGGL